MAGRKSVKPRKSLAPQATEDEDADDWITKAMDGDADAHQANESKKSRKSIASRKSLAVNKSACGAKKSGASSNS